MNEYLGRLSLLEVEMTPDALEEMVRRQFGDDAVSGEAGPGDSALLREASACTPPGSRIVFSHRIPRDTKALEGLLNLIGEPFQSEVSSEDLPGYLDGTGWTVVSDVDRDPARGIERFAIAERV